MQAARHTINATREERARQPINPAPSLVHAVDTYVLAAELFGDDVDDEAQDWLPWPAPGLADQQPLTAQCGSYCHALNTLFADITQQGTLYTLPCTSVIPPTPCNITVTPPPKKRRANRRKAAAEDAVATPAYADLPALEDAPMYDNPVPDHAVVHCSPFTPAIGRLAPEDREVDLGGVVVHVEQCVQMVQHVLCCCTACLVYHHHVHHHSLRAAVDGTPRPGMPAFLQPGFRGTSPMPLPSRTARPRRTSTADVLRTESETSTGPRRPLLGDTDVPALLDESHMLLPDLAMLGTEDYSLAIEVAGVTQTQFAAAAGQHDSFGCV